MVLIGLRPLIGWLKRVVTCDSFQGAIFPRRGEPLQRDCFIWLFIGWYWDERGGCEVDLDSFEVVCLGDFHIKVHAVIGQRWRLEGLLYGGGVALDDGVVFVKEFDVCVKFLDGGVGVVCE